MANAAEIAAGPVVEKFASSAGRWLGYFGIAVGTVAVVAAAWDGFTDHWKGAVIGLIIGLVSWLVLARPAAAVHQNGVLLRNMARDSFIPASKIERCKTGQTLMIRAGGEMFHGLGVGRSARSMMRQERGPRFGGVGLGMLGGGGASSGGLAEPVHRLANEEQTGGTYTEYVDSRITTLGQTAKPDDLEPVTAWSRMSIACLVVMAAAAVTLFF